MTATKKGLEELMELYNKDNKGFFVFMNSLSEKQLSSVAKALPLLFEYKYNGQEDVSDKLDELNKYFDYRFETFRLLKEKPVLEEALKSAIQKGQDPRQIAAMEQVVQDYNEACLRSGEPNILKTKTKATDDKKV